MFDALTYNLPKVKQINIKLVLKTLYIKLFRYSFEYRTLRIMFELLKIIKVSHRPDLKKKKYRTRLRKVFSSQFNSSQLSFSLLYYTLGNAYLICSHCYC